MAIYHLEAKIISRGSGRSAVAAAAYMSCSQILNDYDGIQHDYTRKKGLVWQQIFLPRHAPVEWQDRKVLWNAVEENEKTKDTRLAREFVAALPIELSKSEWQHLLTDFIQEQFVSDGMCADVAIHDTDGHNPHAHIMLTMRPLDEQGNWQYKTEKEYLCVRNSEEQGFTAAEFKTAQADGWEKQYPYKVGRKKVYMSPSDAKAQGYERVSKYPKSTKYGRQNPISERWNSDEQLLVWRKKWAEIVNKHLAKHPRIEIRIDHRSHTDRGLDEQPTIHEGVTARALDTKGILSERREINRQIKADNALLRELKSTVKKLAQTVKNTIPILAEAMENLRENMIIFCYQLRHIRTDKHRIWVYIAVVKPELERYTSLVQQIKDKTKMQKDLFAEKKETPLFQLPKLYNLSRHIVELTEELEELKSEKELLLHTLDCTDDTDISAVKKDISFMENTLKKLEEKEEKYTVELNDLLKRYRDLKEDIAEADTTNLMAAQLALRPDRERSAAVRLQSVYGDKYDPLLINNSKQDVEKLLTEDSKAQPIGELLCLSPQQQRIINRHEQER